MNILMIHPHDIYSELEPWTVRITYLADEFVKRGHKVKLVYHLLDTNLSPEEAQNRQEFPFETIPFIRYQRTLFKKLQIINKIAEWADVIHFQKCFPHTALPAIWASYRHGRPVHYDWDDWEYEIYNYRPLNKFVGQSINILEKILPGLVDTVSVSSEQLRQLCIERGVREHRIFKAHVCADLNLFSPEKDGTKVRHMHDLEGKVVLYLGQLHGAQYVELFIRAAHRIISRRQDVIFMIVGMGDRFGELHALTERLGIGHKIVFTGSVSHHMVPQYIAAADVAVACFEDNKQTRSKSPLKVVEYMASGKAIVATDMGEVRKMLQGCAILAKPGDVGSLVTRIETLLDNPMLRSELGQKARKRAEDEYNWSVTASNLLEAYHVGLEQCNKTIWSKKKHYNIISKPKIQKKNNGKIRDFIERNRDLIGILDGGKIYSGPSLVQLDLTNRCNNDCLACWCRSPLLLERIMDPETQSQTLPFDLVQGLLHELHEMGTREIYLAGGGEPFMHPQINEILGTIKDYKMVCHTNTNFTLVDKKRAEKIADLGIDHLTISLWAGTAEMYSKTHPNKTEETFYQIQEVLKYLVSTKHERPFIKLYNVISRVNYREIDQMVDFALDAGVESVEFTMVDTIPGYTDTLLLSEDERICLVDECHRVKKKVEEINRKTGRNMVLFKFDDFLRRISGSDALEGNYDRNIVDSMPCYVGWFFARILPDGNVNSCLKSHRIPVGNIYKHSFRDIWLSDKQAEFRKKTMVYIKDDPYFSLIGNDPSAKVGCYKSCDNLGHNQHIHDRFASLNFSKKILLQTAKHLINSYN